MKHKHTTSFQDWPCNQYKFYKLQGTLGDGKLMSLPQLFLISQKRRLPLPRALSFNSLLTSLQTLSTPLPMKRTVQSQLTEDRVRQQRRQRWNMSPREWSTILTLSWSGIFILRVFEWTFFLWVILRRPYQVGHLLVSIHCFSERNRHDLKIAHPQHS